MEFMLLASFVAEVKGMMFYYLRRSRASRGEHMMLRRQPSNAFDAKCVEVRILRCEHLVGHLEAAVAARVSPLMCGSHVERVGGVLCLASYVGGMTFNAFTHIIADRHLLLFLQLEL